MMVTIGKMRLTTAPQVYRVVEDLIYVDKLFMLKVPRVITKKNRRLFIPRLILHLTQVLKLIPQPLQLIVIRRPSHSGSTVIIFHRCLLLIDRKVLSFKLTKVFVLLLMRPNSIVLCFFDKTKSKSIDLQYSYERINIIHFLMISECFLSILCILFALNPVLCLLNNKTIANFTISGLVDPDNVVLEGTGKNLLAWSSANDEFETYSLNGSKICNCTFPLQIQKIIWPENYNIIVLPFPGTTFSVVNSTTCKIIQTYSLMNLTHTAYQD